MQLSNEISEYDIRERKCPYCKSMLNYSLHYRSGVTGFYYINLLCSACDITCICASISPTLNDHLKLQKIIMRKYYHDYLYDVSICLNEKRTTIHYTEALKRMQVDWDLSRHQILDAPIILDITPKNMIEKIQKYLIFL